MGRKDDALALRAGAGGGPDDPAEGGCGDGGPPTASVVSVDMCRWVCFLYSDDRLRVDHVKGGREDAMDGGEAGGVTDDVDGWMDVKAL